LSSTKINPYLKTQILTASPEQLQLMLYDGLIRFCHQAKTAIADNNHENTYESINRAQKILMELIATLKPEVYPELCKNLGALYNYIYRQLIQANVAKDAAVIDKALDVIHIIRSSWVDLIEKLRSEPQDGARNSVNTQTQNLRVVG